ncbi:ATP-grasp fold amidoligase family protein [Halalkalibacter sp. APA_J-10(15)]|uniref:ATP-grasp fold amidoligase family protein n=1 Tax=Halalkalibacter sp. APA_J-10(15) TaxID=2933805 RepID=UPI001FF11383|nr:ATP-grasp fold amidoligase family protein [Halalkalibacter sp. APA_J-10(15)]MCK0470258.1 teichuronopeptide biosynthesis [Halalkalibacter sp. APA_J-10(15)]
MNSKGSKQESDNEKRLLNELITKDEKLRNAIEEKRRIANEKLALERKNKEVTSSYVWKATWPIRKVLTLPQTIVNKLKSKLAAREVAKTKKLELLNRRLKRDLEVLTEKYHYEVYVRKELEGKSLKQNLEQLDTSFSLLTEALKQSIYNGEILPSLETLMKSNSTLNEEYVRSLTEVAKHFENSEEVLRQPIYQKILDGLKAHQVPEFMTRSAYPEGDIYLNQVASFRSCITLRIRKRQLDSFIPEWILDNKSVAYQFVDHLNIPRPNVSKETYSYQNLKEQYGVAIKPLSSAGSRGVYLVYDRGDIVNVRSGQGLSSWRDLQSHMKADLQSGLVEHDTWLIEELIFENKESKKPARDFKFYCFYGKVALILEVIRSPDLKYCWWNRNGKMVETGKYAQQNFKGQGVDLEMIERVEELSTEIPSPFIRMDFLFGEENQMYFGEFTPKPGHYDKFNKETDLLLGEYFLEAEVRLVKDLLEGKEFSEFNHIANSVLNRRI